MEILKEGVVVAVLGLDEGGKFLYERYWNVCQEGAYLKSLWSFIFDNSSYSWDYFSRAFSLNVS